MQLPPVAVFDSEHPSSLAILQSLGGRGVPVHIYSSERLPAGRWSPQCKKFERCPCPVQFDAFQQWLKNKLSSGEITRVAPTSDLLAYHCALLREHFPVEARETLHTLTEIEDALIKPRFNRICAEIGVQTPQTWYPESVEAARQLASRLPYPVMIKPRSHLAVGMYYRGALVQNEVEFLRDFRELTAAPGQEPVMARYPDLRWPMVQVFEPSAKHSVFSLCGLRDRHSGIVASAGVCKVDQWPPNIGIGSAFTTLDDAATFEAGHRVVNRFLNHGLFQIEFLVRDAERLAIDLNPRAYQMLTFDIARGHDLPWLWYRSTLGEKLEVQPAAQLGLKWRRNLPFHLGHWVRCLRGPNRRQRWRHYKTLRDAAAVSATEGSPIWVRIACELRLLRHPRSLVRPYWTEHAD